ncbi:MAG: heparan-alpha-glucosaminide N-acetyltransferase domain-containing protein [Acidaminococcaceae bacterium]
MPRYHLIDTLRGFAILNVLVYHFLYDVVHIFSLPLPWFEQTWSFVWQQVGASFFILLAGAMLQVSRRPVQRGLELVAWGLVATGVTWVLMPAELIVFGILQLLGCALLVGTGLRVLLVRQGWHLTKRRALLGVASCLVGFFVTRNLMWGQWGAYNYVLGSVSQEFYTHTWGFVVGLPLEDFSSADYYPLLPWGFVFGGGYFGWTLLPQGHWLTVEEPVLAWLGRRSLVLYLVHQPVILGVLYWLWPYFVSN